MYTDEVIEYDMIAVKLDGIISLARLEPDEPDMFYWGYGGTKWVLRSTEVLEHLGKVCSDDYDKQREIELNFYKKYHPIKASLVSSAGWLAPDGKFFPCNYGQHDGLAFVIAINYYNSLGGVRKLEEMGWVLVMDEGYVVTVSRGRDTEFQMTQKQLDTLFDLSQLPENPKHPLFKDNILRNAEMYARKGVR